MIHFGTTTSKTPEEALEQSVKFFGPSGTGLEQVQSSPRPDLVYLTGGGGYVQVMAWRINDGSTEVDIISQEWEIPAREFLAEL